MRFERTRFFVSCAVCVFACTCVGASAQADGHEEDERGAIGTPGDKRDKFLFDIREGRVRVELEGITGIEGGSVDRTDNVGFKGTIEYEVPLARHLTVSGRLMPLFYFHENLDNNEEKNLAAFGLGPVFRVYSKGREFRGFFVEIGVSAIAQTNKFEGNSASFNFLSEGGVGYMFPRDIHVSATIQHISNAGLGERNGGVNFVGIGAGFAFKPGQFRERQANRTEDK